MEHHANGREAQFDRFVANLLYVIASGKRIDDTRTPKFGKILEDLYENPFTKKKRKKQPKTSAEIKNYICGRIQELIEEENHHGSDDAGGENRPG